MSNLLRVLIVEDSENDASLLGLQLKSGGYDPVVKRVETSKTMSAALDSEGWDLVISDYSMPQFSGGEALAICRKKGLDIPFILVSGRIGEAQAVEIVKAGAHDYVPKDDLTWLVPAVNRELNAAQERRIRKHAEASMAHLATIVESCDDAIFSQTLGGIILSWNSGAQQMYGYSAKEMIGQSISILVPPNRSEDLENVCEKIKRGERIERFETERIRKDGTTINVSITVSPLKSNGQITGASIVARDITERIQREKERVLLIEELTDALTRVKTLSGLLPICATCKKIRNDDGYWEQVEIYIKERSNADFTHGICPDCQTRIYPQYSQRKVAQSGCQK